MNADYRTGIGYDLHRLVPGRKLILGGVEIPFEKGPDGHSDGDVILHALTDALLGAAALDRYDAAAALVPTDDYVEKQGRSTGRYRLAIGDTTLSLYVKKHMRLPWWQRRFGSRRSFPGPAEAANLRHAAELGIRVPETVFAGANPAHPCGSLLATRELEGYLPLHIYIPGPLARMPEGERRARKRALIGRLAARIGLKMLLVAGLVITGIALAAHPFARGMPDMLGARALLGLGVAGVQPALYAMISRRAPSGAGGAIQGYASSAAILGFFFGPFFGGWLANHVGVGGVFFIAAGIALSSAIVAAVVAKRRGRDRQIPPVPEPIPR